VALVLAGEVLTAAAFEHEIRDGRAILRGDFDVAEVRRLVGLVGAGALPAPLTRLASSQVGPALGAAALRDGVRACGLGLAAVGAFMTARYRVAGALAAGGLVLNLALQVSSLQVLGAALTLPGVAGVILSVGMGVDAAVLAFERIREEREAGRTPRAALRNGFARSRSAVVDSNLTTALTAGVLYAFGSGPVRGFAVTLGLGLASAAVVALWALPRAMEAGGVEA